MYKIALQIFSVWSFKKLRNNLPQQLFITVVYLYVCKAKCAAQMRAPSFLLQKINLSSEK